MLGGFISKYMTGVSLRQRVAQAVVRRWPGISLERKIAWDIFSRPNYAYGTYRAAMEAVQLGIKKISIIEFGVAGGNGLVALEQISKEIGEKLGITIEVYGFDTGQGMPPPEDFRDLPHVWQAGFFRMNPEELNKRLESARLVIGNVSETVKTFLTSSDIPPIGFISFDLDYYSSTVQAFKLLDGSQNHFLPRVYCYFDDIVGDDWEQHSEFAGVLLAINEFNQSHDSRKIAPIANFRFKRQIQAPWNEQTYIYHDFQHPRYTSHILPNKDWHLPLSPNKT